MPLPNLPSSCDNLVNYFYTIDAAAPVKLIKVIPKQKAPWRNEEINQLETLERLNWYVGSRNYRSTLIEHIANYNKEI